MFLKDQANFTEEIETIRIVKVTSSTISSSIPNNDADMNENEHSKLHDILSLMCKYYGMYPNYEGFYKTVSKAVKKMEKEDEQKVKQKYGLPNDMSDDDLIVHPDFEMIKNDIETNFSRLYTNQSWASTLVKTNFMLGPFTNEESSVLDSIYKDNDAVPVLFIRRIGDKTQLCFVIFDEEKKFLINYTLTLNFDIYGDNEFVKRERMIKVFEECIAKYEAADNYKEELTYCSYLLLIGPLLMSFALLIFLYLNRKVDF